jgi:CHAT domain-containing protein
VGTGGDRLPAVARELRAVRRRLPGARVLAGSEARREEVLAALPGARLVHLAGHARARPDLPFVSSLTVHDGWITASDLRTRPLRGALVVLSACRTGDPSLPWRGEAWGGFPRALLAAGAAAVVGSRYEVRDETALAWMEAFYGALGRGPERALQAAARAVRRRFPHPADWAAFLLVRGGWRVR